MRVGIAAVMAASVLAVGCIPESTPGAGDPSGPITTAEAETGEPKTEGRTVIEEQWDCGDIVLTSTCAGKRRTFCSGTVKTGSYPEESTFFNVNGVERRWSWSDYSVVIEGGYGRYYNFRGVPEGKRIKPSGVFRCTKRWW